MKEEVNMIVYLCDNCGEKLKDGNDFIGYIDADIWNGTNNVCFRALNDGNTHSGEIYSGSRQRSIAY